MKRILSFFLSVLLLLSLFTTIAEADFVNKVSVDATSGKITIKGKIIDQENINIVSIFLLTPGNSMDDIATMITNDGIMAHVGMVYPDSEGFYEYEFTCSQPSGQ